MSDGRCRACGAAVAPNASWCSLCFADLRPPAAEPAREPATVAAAPAQPATPTQPLSAAQPVTAAQPVAQPVQQPAAGAVAVTPAAVDGETEPGAVEPGVDIDPADPLGLTEKPQPTWPCPRCGHAVDIELDACDMCGTAFLAGAAAAQPVRLPGVGDVNSMSSSQRLLFACGIALAVTVVLVLLAFIGGHLFG
jgi:uncharacterized OB-fold protein